MTDLRYPIGDFQWVETFSAADRAATIDRIEAAPGKLRAAVAGLDDAKLETPYRPGGWTVRQVVHHVFDSHANAFIRCKLTATEDHPTIRPYEEADWALLPDAHGPIADSLALVDHLHARWTVLLRGLPASAYQRTCFHPGSKLILTLDRLIATYAWHGAHHTAHITELRRRSGW